MIGALTSILPSVLPMVGNLFGPKAQSAVQTGANYAQQGAQYAGQIADLRRQIAAQREAAKEARRAADMRRIENLFARQQAAVRVAPSGAVAIAPRSVETSDNKILYVGLAAALGLAVVMMNR